MINIHNIHQIYSVYNIYYVSLQSNQINDCVKKKVMKSLEKIIEKFSGISPRNNHSDGGGLCEWKFASVRHESAKKDNGKVTLGEATQMFKKATGLETAEVKKILQHAVPYMEWHHAGKLPKQYGGGMKKTYFLRAEQMVKIARDWADYYSNNYYK